MNNLKNRVQLIGNLGAAPEVRTTEGGRKLVRIRMATNEVYKNQQGEKITETTWHNVVAWGVTAEIAERLLTKGSEVMIEGKIQNRDYTDKDGQKKYFTEVQALSLYVLDKKAA